MKSGTLPPIAARVEAPATGAPEPPPQMQPRRSGIRKSTALSWVVVLALLGALGIAPILLQLWDIWTDDPLKSLGMLIVPVSIILTLRVWRQNGWELRGNWWGLLPMLLSLYLSAFRHSLDWRVFIGPVNLNFLSPKVGLYLFGSGFVLLFAGWRVWKKAWFPLALLLCAQPMPYFFLIYGDLPLQDISAHIARSFATLIGFPPTSKELLRLMFTPDFGMFIAPGCDGIRGALTMGYLALITGYLKKVSLPRWIAYTLGGVMLGYVFNLVRLCALVIYYRLALGHRGPEHFAKWADYMIGGCLFLLATLLFLWIVTRKDDDQPAPGSDPVPGGASTDWTAREQRLFLWRGAAFALTGLFFVVPGLHAIRTYQKSLEAEVRDGDIGAAQLDARLPARLGSYTRSRTWQESVDRRIVLESGAYSGADPDEAILGIWLPTREHNMHISWMARGQDPLQRADRAFLTAEGKSIAFDTAFYSDSITDSIAGNAFCTPESCVPSPSRMYEGLVLTVDPLDFDTRGKRAVSIFFRIDRPHSSADQAAVFEQLTAEAKEFLSGADFTDISRRFQ